MDNHADEEPAGPSVDSDDPEERILARRLRIQKRQEAQKKCVLFCFHSRFTVFSVYRNYSNVWSVPFVQPSPDLKWGIALFTKTPQCPICKKNTGGRR